MKRWVFLLLALPVASAAAQGPDACALLPRADAEAAVGVPVADPVREGGPAPGITASICQYMSKQRNGFVRLSVERYESPEMFAFVTENLGKKAGDEPVAGVGSRAVWRGKSGDLKVVVDRDLFSLRLVAATESKPLKDQAIALMKKILARR